MTKDMLNGLIGLSIESAEEFVRKQGLVPRIYREDEIRTASCLPSNVVELNYDSENKVVTAETQVTIDAKYN